MDYELDVRAQQNADQDIEATGQEDVKTGAYELYRVGGGGKKGMSCACHWAVNQAAGDAAGRMWGRCYAVLPSGVYVRRGLRHPAARGPGRRRRRRGLPLGQPLLDDPGARAVPRARPDIKLRFGGMPYDRVDALLSGTVPAAAIWSAPTYIVEQQGCRKILDTTFMAGFMFDFETDPDDVEKYFNALKRAQMELDLQPEPYKQHYLKEIPERFHDMIDVRRFGPGERIVFLPVHLGLL